MSEREILGPLYGLNGSFLLLIIGLTVAVLAVFMVWLDRKGW